jgi:hypothetical protein
MTTGNSDSVWYVYGIVPASLDGSCAPAGLDDASVTLESWPDHEVAALVSVLRGPTYEPATLEAKSGDVEWLSPRAVAHDRVLTWASDHAAVIPLPMFSLFSSADAVRAMLRDRGPHLDRTLKHIGDAREYALRVYRVDSEMLDTITDLSDRLRDLAASAAKASPGQRYLLERKLDAEKRSEMRNVTQRLMDETVAALSAHAVDCERSAIPRVTDAESNRGTMVLNASFLVAPSRFRDFQEALSAIVTARQQGFRFDFTGPWPPYHFVNEHANVT